MTEENYDHIISKYITEARKTGAKEYRAECLVTLQEYVKFIQDSLVEEKEKHKQFKTPLPIHVTDRAGMFVGVLAFFAHEANEKLLNQYVDFADQTIKVTQALIERISKDETIEADYEEFVKTMKKKISTNKTLLTLRFYKDALVNKVNGIAMKYTVGNLIEPVKRSIQQAFFEFDQSLNYVKNKDLDNAVSVYLHHSHYSSMLYPISRVIADGDVKPALIALSELTELVNADLKCGHPTAKLILYISVVRAVFEEAYTIFPELNRFAKANAAFREKCETFASKTVGEIAQLLPKDVTKGYTKGLEVRTMFRKKQIGYMKEMEIMLNPIDLMIHIYKSVNALRTYFMCDAGSLTFRETNTLVLILLSVSPPSNTVSIARFLDHWKDLVLLPAVSKYIENFIGAVELLYSFQDIEEEEEEE